MNDEQLSMGTTLANEIKRVKEIISQWDTSKGLCNGQAYILVGVHEKFTYVPACPYVFQTMRALSMQYFTDMLADLEKKFAEL